MDPIPAMKLDMTIEGESIRRDINKDLAIDESTLSESLEKQPALYAYYSILLQKAALKKANAEFSYDRIYNSSLSHARDIFSEKGKITDKQLTSYVENMEEVLKARENSILANHQYGILMSMTKALEQKKDCLISIGHRKRAEWDALANKTINRSGIE